MSIKSEVSAGYLEKTKEQFSASNHYHMNANVLVTGANNEGSIAEEIMRVLHARMHKSLAPPMDVQNFISHEMQDYSAIVMCHGAMHLDWFEDIPAHRIHEIIGVNLTGTAKLVQRFVKDTIKKPYRKTIISIGSMAYNKVLNGSAVYCASKAGAAQLMKCLAWELAPKGYDVYSIHPSNVADTPMERETIRGLARYRHMSMEEAEAYWTDSVIRSAMLSKTEIARLVADLIEGKFPYLSGCNLELAGGAR